MSAHFSRRATTRRQTTDPDIEALQDHLLKTLHTAFDPTATTRSDIYMAQNYNLTTYTDSNADPFAKPSYQVLTEKARTYIEKAEAERPLRPKVKVNMNKKNNTFVTYVEVEGSMANRRFETMRDEPLERYQPPEQITYDNILLSVSSNAEKKKDDLEELRRMIRKAKRDINAYGRELMSLKDEVVGVNDYASRELGYGANNDLMYNVENEVNMLKRTGEFKPVNSNRPNMKSVKPSENKRFSKIGTSILNSSGPGVKIGTGRATLRKW